MKRLFGSAPLPMACMHASAAGSQGVVTCACGAQVQQVCARCSETFSVGWHRDAGARCTLLGMGQLCRLTSPAKPWKCHDYEPGQFIEVNRATQTT